MPYNEAVLNSTDISTNDIKILSGLLVTGAVVVATGLVVRQHRPIASNGDSSDLRGGTAIENLGNDRSVSSWKKFTNTRYGFEFRYPANWYIAEGTTTTDHVFIQSPNRQANFEVDAVSFGGQVFSEYARTVGGVHLNEVTFQGRKALLYSCPDVNPCPSQRSYGKQIRIVDLPPMWEKYNGISYEVARGNEHIFPVAESILGTFKFTSR